MANATVHRLTAFEDSGPVLMARIVGSDGSNLQQADVSTITYTVHDVTVLNSSDIAQNSPLTVSNVILTHYRQAVFGRRTRPGSISSIQ